MADDKRISELPLATTPLAGTEELEIVQGGVNKRVASSNLGGGGSVASVTGDGVDNTDPANPVVSFPVANEVVFTPAGNIAATDVQAAIEELDTEKAPLASPTFTGTPAAPTAAGGTNTTQIATTAFVQAATSNATVVSATTATAGATITLDMDSKIQKIHVGDNPFAGPKTLAMSNTTNALDFIFIFEITNLAAVLTFPADWISDDFNFDGTDWTPGEIGKYKMGGPFDGTNWHVSIVGPNA